MPVVKSRDCLALIGIGVGWLKSVRFFGTLIADEQQVYDLSYLDNQLVLGINRTLSVIELKVQWNSDRAPIYRSETGEDQRVIRLASIRRASFLGEINCDARHRVSFHDSWTACVLYKARAVMSSRWRISPANSFNARQMESSI